MALFVIDSITDYPDDTLVLEIPKVPDKESIDALNERITYLRFYYAGILEYCTNSYFEYGDRYYDWPPDTPLTQIHADLEANGWKCTENYPDTKSPQYVHLAARKALYKALKEWATRAPGFGDALGPFPPYRDNGEVEPHDPKAEIAYIRFGEVPACGYSMNRIFDEPEDGVSCFEAEILPDGKFRLTRLTQHLQCEAAWYILFEDKPIYRLYGEPVGYGWAGEPVLKVERAERIDDTMLV